MTEGLETLFCGKTSKEHNQMSLNKTLGKNLIEGSLLCYLVEDQTDDCNCSS